MWPTRATDHEPGSGHCAWHSRTTTLMIMASSGWEIIIKYLAGGINCHEILSMPTIRFECPPLCNLMLFLLLRLFSVSSLISILQAHSCSSLVLEPGQCCSFMTLQNIRTTQGHLTTKSKICEPEVKIHLFAEGCLDYWQPEFKGKPLSFFLIIISYFRFYGGFCVLFVASFLLPSWKLHKLNWKSSACLCVGVCVCMCVSMPLASFVYFMLSYLDIF